MSCILQYEFVIWIYHMWITAAEFLLIHADPSYVKLVALASPVTNNARKV